MNIDVHYGKGFVSLQIPEDNIEQLIKPWHDEAEQDNKMHLQQALADEQTADFQRKIAGKRLCLLTEDGTRDVPFEDIFPQLAPLLKQCSALRFIICTGTHDPDTPENRRIKEHAERACNNAGITNFTIHAHDCQADSFIDAGKTTRGTDIIYDPQADDADVFLVVSDTKTHYFAGYSNPVKNFVPGICAYQTTEQNHALALEDNSTFGLHPWHGDPGRRNNPVAEDQVEGLRLIAKGRPVYTLAIISTSRQIQWARFGPIEPVTSEAFSKIDQRNTHTVRPVSRLIVSPGGFPNDVSLYIAQRALELTKNAITDGGDVLFLAECRDGIGEKRTLENFYNRLTAPIDHILKSIETKYVLYSHKPYKFAQLIQRLRRISIHSQIPDDLVKAAHLYPTDKPQSVVDAWLAEDPQIKITIVDGANKIALYAQT
ncbi:MAG: lactate racemase domain-containing protein [Planctomycetota bacterium]|jgi:nickel-dependent lactate racemase